MDRQTVESCTILRCVGGSTLYGLSVDANADRDEMGVCVEPIRFALGFTGFEKFEHRDAAVREGKKDAKSRPGDLDLNIYSLRRYAKLAADGNPTMLELLYAPEDACTVYTYYGAQLQSMAGLFVSKKAIRKYLGYMRHQRERMLGLRGQKDVNRPELVEKYGYDTKYAVHMLRLGFQAEELLAHGSIELPIAEPTRSYLLGVRTGQVTEADTVRLSEELERRVEDALTRSSMRETANYAVIEKWVIDVYTSVWARTRWETKG